MLESVDMHLEGILYPPDEIGLIGMLEALSMELLVLDSRTGQVISMLPVYHSLLPVETGVALLSVRDQASMIMERAQDGFEVPPDEIGVIEALMLVEMGAENIVMTVESYLFPSVPIPD